ncbi:LOW QUALITY PROTEIN: hypothetical protein M513_04596 [Trichuris suis]|uniref:Uncharacterized protein n=1 Tax=Trichuris suis TaxID=68888 RepID=A0A085MB53_9BILA|nr:LOW QUALITY PROTEIN: hypothetical protein M513_04596 [Trichuris suis]
MRGPGKNEAERFFFSVHRAVGALRVKGAEGELRCRAALQTERCNTVGRRDVTSSVRRCQRCYTSTADSKNSSPQTFVLTTLCVSALLDPGSEVTLIREDVAGQLELKGLKQTFHAVDFELSSVDRQHVFAVKGALTVPRLNVTNRKVNWTTLMKQRWAHLRNIEPKEFKYTNVVVLIGVDVDEAHEQYRIVKPPKGAREPKAVEICRSKSWSLEIVSVKRMDMEILSAEEKQALGILQSSLRKVDGHYECKLLWRRPV